MKEPEPFNQEICICLSDKYEIRFIHHEFKGVRKWYKLVATEDRWEEVLAIEVNKVPTDSIWVRGRIILDCVHPFTPAVKEEIEKLSRKELSAIEHIVSRPYPLPTMSTNWLENAYRCRIIPYLEPRTENNNPIGFM